MPLKTEKGEAPEATGAGAGQVSGSGASPTRLVGLNVPLTNVAPVMGEAAPSLKKRVMFVTSSPPPTSDIMMAFCPPGLTSRMSRSAGKVLLNDQTDGDCATRFTDGDGDVEDRQQLLRRGAHGPVNGAVWRPDQAPVPVGVAVGEVKCYCWLGELWTGVGVGGGEALSPDSGLSGGRCAPPDKVDLKLASGFSIEMPVGQCTPGIQKCSHPGILVRRCNHPNG